MADSEWGKLLTVALGSGFFGAAVVKVVDILYLEIRRRSDRSRSAKDFVDSHLDPLLKSADELVGKLRSLADEDFKTLYDVNLDGGHIENHDFRSLLFLLAKLWANIEKFRHEGLSVSIAKDMRGKRLQSFLDCMESRRIRIVDRMSQRAVGELLLNRRNGLFETITFIEFIQLVETNPDARRWVISIAHFLSRMRHTAERQLLLQYGG